MWGMDALTGSDFCILRSGECLAQYIKPGMHAVRLLFDRACALILIKSLNEGVLPRGFTTEYS